ncbi:MAG: hypothetical protein V1738_04170 [Patescibacteria group bacterium]
MTRFVFALAVLTVACVVPSSAIAHTTPYTHFHMPYKELHQSIGRAEAKLRSASIGTKEVGGRQAVLAVWNPAGNHNDIRLVYVRDGVSQTKGFTVQVRPWNGLAPRPGVDLYNGVNTRYAVTSPSDWYVLALKTNTRTEPGAIYVPYNPAYQTPEIAAAGRSELIETVLAAEKIIARRNVKSTIRPDALVTDLLETSKDPTKLDADGRMLLTLLLIEHMDVDEFRARGAVWTSEKVLVTLALNGPRTYRYAVSSAGAGGLAQFIEPTYRDIQTRYPAAALPTSFVDAMRNHVHAVIAQYCLMDRAFKTLTDTGFSVPTDRNLAGWYFAAAYNAGEHRAIPAYREYQRCVTAKRRGVRCTFSKGLPTETQNYVREYSAVYDHMFRKR